MQHDAESELLKRCVESIAKMGDSPTVVVDADDCSNIALSSVAAQLQQKGWLIEVLPADDEDPAQLVISSPSVPKPIPAEYPAAPSGAEPRQKTYAETMAEDNLRKWTELERARQSGRSPASEVTFTASKTAIVWGAIAVGVITIFAAVWFIYISPRRQLDQLAKETCSDLDGSIMLVAGATLGSAINKAERLGFSGPELGDRMREHCPSIMRQIADFASSD